MPLTEAAAPAAPVTPADARAYARLRAAFAPVKRPSAFVGVPSVKVPS